MLTFAVQKLCNRFILIPVIRRNHVKTSDKMKADLRFPLNQPFADEPNSQEAVIQRRPSIFQNGRL